MCDGSMIKNDPKSTAAALIAHANKAFGGSQSEGAYSAKDASDLLELACNQSILQNPARYNPCVGPVQAAKTVADIATNLLAVIPTQTRRDEEQEAMQQFSTPPHLAYLMAWAANLSDKDVVLEPSAGVGGLAVFALNAGATVYANELSERRSRLLGILPLKERFSENAEQLNNVLPAHVRPSAIVMNPPFSRSPRLKDRKDAEIGMRHIRQALLRLRPGGRAVILMGDGMGDWSEIKQKYTVRASIGIDGREYTKYGCAYDTRIVVIDKVENGGSCSCIPTTGTVSVLQAVELLAPARELRGKIEHDTAPVTTGNTTPANQPAGVPTNGTPATQVPRPDSGSDGRVDATSAAVEQRTASNTLKITAAVDAAAAPMSDAIFEAYRPQRLHVEGAQQHPTPLVQSAAMASVLPPAPTYAPCIPHELIESGALSEAQIEAVVYAGQAHRQYLPEVEVEDPITREKRRVTFRKGFMVGDGTGLGKGREGAAIIMDYFARGGRKAMWISKNGALLKDAIRDWTDLGGDKDQILPLENFTVTTPIPKSDRPTILFLTYHLLRSGAKPRITDPVEKRVTVKDLPVDPGFAYAGYVAKAFIRLANNPDRHLWSAYDTYMLRGGPYSGKSLYQAVRDIDHDFDPENPSKRSIRAAMGMKVTADRPKSDGEKSRLRQVIDWCGRSFDGVIWADEAHCCKSSLA